MMKSLGDRLVGYVQTATSDDNIQTTAVAGVAFVAGVAAAFVNIWAVNRATRHNDPRCPFS